MIKILLIVLLSCAVKVGFYSIDFFEPVKKFPFFSNVHTDFDEILEGFSWKKITNSQRTQLKQKISELSENLMDSTDRENHKILSERLNTNPQHYSNPNNLQHHPLILQLLSMIYQKYSTNGIFTLYLLFDTLTALFLYQSYRSTQRRPSGHLPLLLISLNPLSIAAVCLLNTYLFMYFFFSFILADLVTPKKQKNGNITVVFGGILAALDPHYLSLLVLMVIYEYDGLKQRVAMLLKLGVVTGLTVSYVYFSTGLEGMKAVYVNLLFVTDGNESMSMVWYFYII